MAAPTSRGQTAAPNISTAGTARTPEETADTAWATAAESERLNWKQWVETNLRRNSIDLLPRIPRDDAAKLEALAASGAMNWTEINAALDAKIKLATSQKLADQKQELDLRPPSWQQVEDDWTAHNEWNKAKAAGESEIWSRYFAKSSEAYANDPVTEVGPAALEHLLAREKVIDELGRARDKELAELAQKFGAEPARPTASPMRATPYLYATAASQLTSAETDAMNRLDGCFTASGSMTKTISDVAGEIISNVAGVK